MALKCQYICNLPNPSGSDRGTRDTPIGGVSCLSRKSVFHGKPQTGQPELIGPVLSCPIVPNLLVQQPNIRVVRSNKVLGHKARNRPINSLVHGIWFIGVGPKAILLKPCFQDLAQDALAAFWSANGGRGGLDSPTAMQPLRALRMAASSGLSAGMPRNYEPDSSYAWMVSKAIRLIKTFLS